MAARSWKILGLVAMSFLGGCKSNSNQGSDERFLAAETKEPHTYDYVWVHFKHFTAGNENPEWHVCVWMAKNVTRKQSGQGVDGLPEFKEADNDTNVFLNNTVALNKDDKSPNGYYIQWDKFMNYLKNNVKGNSDDKNFIIDVFATEYQRATGYRGQSKIDTVETGVTKAYSEGLSVVMEDLKEKMKSGQFNPPRSNQCPSKETVAAANK